MRNGWNGYRNYGGGARRRDRQTAWREKEGRRGGGCGFGRFVRSALGAALVAFQ
jgi:hypothetical protein